MSVIVSVPVLGPMLVGEKVTETVQVDWGRLSRKSPCSKIHRWSTMLLIVSVVVSEISQLNDRVVLVVLMP